MVYRKSNMSEDQISQLLDMKITATSAAGYMQRPFIAWDGEGMNLSGDGNRQHYVLFGSSHGDPLISEDLTAFECIDHILDIAQQFPEHIHISYAFTYDVNMIVHSLPRYCLENIQKNDYTKVKHNDYMYRLDFRKSKFFSITRWKRGEAAKQHVKIYDLFTFFQTSFVKACKNVLGDVDMTKVEEGKKARGSFNDINYVREYWTDEIELLRQFAEQFRGLMAEANFELREWYGPGALASFVLKREGIQHSKAISPDGVREAARYAYYGGRFELFNIGYWHEKVYGYDINSAYPYAIAQLPNLQKGRWIHNPNPDKIVEFGVYKVSYRSPEIFGTSVGPIAHRDQHGLISYPGHVATWIWSPEAYVIRNSPHLVIEEAWEFESESDHRPFDWIPEMYHQRKIWKAQGNTAQLALKLCMNSIYGKTAQRVGWNVEKRTAPKWHQLEWAGWITSTCRAMILGKISRIPRDQLIAVETDGIYTTVPPEEMGITNSDQLGGWEISEYDEAYYVQSGVAFIKEAGKWKAKHRGLNATSISPSLLDDFLEGCLPNERFPTFTATTTRFIGLGAALKTDLSRHCVWEVDKLREMNFGHMGKRQHFPQFCPACKQGYSALEKPHRLTVPPPMGDDGMFSTPHLIPWEVKVANPILETDLWNGEELDIENETLFLEE